MNLAELLAQLANIAELDDEQMGALRAQLVDAAEALAAGTIGAEEVGLLGQAADAVETIDAALATRAEEAAELETQIDAALARIRGVGAEDAEADAPAAAGAGPEDEEPAPDDEPVVPEPDQPVVEVPAAAPAPAPAEVPEAVAAAADPPATPTTPRTRARVPARNRPAAPAAVPTGSGLVAAGDIRGRSAGSEFPTIADVGLALIDKALAVGRSGAGGDGEQISVAMRNYSDEFPPERRIADSDSADAVYEKIMAVVRPASTMDAVVAAGGLCAPVAVNYNLVTYGNTKRPLRDSLPSFLATRGGITFNDSPVLTDVLLDQTGGAIGVVTLAQDASGPTKTVQEITCGNQQTEYVQAITSSIKNGNLADRYNPERMRAWIKLVDVAHARKAESLLFAGLISRRTKHYTDTPAKFGAYRDFKRACFGIIEEISDQIRDDEQALRAVVPEYLPAMLATDLVAQQPGDAAHTITEEAIKADMQRWSPQLNFTFVIDGSNGRLLTTPANGGRTPGFDADVDWVIFPEGTFTFLDGGMIDLGVVRDSLLIAANKFITFSETMEGLARPGPLAYHVTSSLCAGGDSQVATDISVCSPQGS